MMIFVLGLISHSISPVQVDGVQSLGISLLSSFLMFQTFSALSSPHKFEKNILQRLFIVFVGLKQRVWLFNDGDAINEK